MREHRASRERTVDARTLAAHGLAAVLLAAVVLLPLVFDPSLDDGYALPKASILRALGLVAATVFLVYVLSRGSLGRSADLRIDLPLLSLAGLAIAASIASVDPVQSFAGEPYQYQGIVTVLLYLGSFYLARLTLGSFQGFRWLLTVIVCTGAVVATYGIAQGLGVDPFWWGPTDGRSISTVGQANDLAAYLDLVIISAIGLWPVAGRRSRIGICAVVVASLLALALTFSRGGYLGLAAAFGVLFVPQFHELPRRWVGATLLALMAGVLVVALAVPTVRTIGASVASRAVATFDLGEGSIRFHLDQWRVGSQIAIEHPLLGTGPETFPLVFRPYLDQVLPRDRAEILGRFRLESPHNELIGVAAEMGLPALVAYVAFLIASASACVRRARAATGASRSIALVVLATLATHVVTNLFKTPDVTTSEVFWITVGAGLAAMGSAAGRSGEHPQGAAAGAR
jgi:putative inorganic carbon (HCO3(-)) transporter